MPVTRTTPALAEPLELRAYLTGAATAAVTIPPVSAPTVRLAYLVPSNRTAQPRAVESLQNAVRLMQSWFADQMARYGFAGKTIRYETEADGVTPKVWVLNVPETDAYLRADNWGNVNTAAANTGIPVFGQSQDWLIVPEMHTEAADGTVDGGVALGASNGSGLDGGVAHLGSNGLAVLKPEYLTDDRPYAGLTLPDIGPYPLVQDKSFAWFEGTTLSEVSSSYLGALFHELTHGLGMPHDNRADENFHGNLMNNGLRGVRGAIHPDLYPTSDTYLSYGMALALSTSRYLNAGQSAPENAAPSVNVSTSGSVSPVNGQLQINFTASDQSPLAVALLSRNGDLVGELPLGSSATSVSRTFTTPYFTTGQADQYTVTVYDVYGNRAGVGRTITPLAGGNRGPQPFFRLSSSTVTATRPITLSAAQTTDPDGPVSALRYEWDLDGDGTFDTAPSTSASFTTSFPTPGVRQLRVRVTDNNGTGASVVSPFIGVRVNPVPQVTSATFVDARSPNLVRVTFNKDVSKSLAAADLKVTDATTGATVSAASVSFDPATRTATFAFGGALPSGRYRATLRGTDVSDLGAVPLDGDANGVPGGDYVFNFAHLVGDADGNGTVNFDDLLILATNYNKPNQTFAQGDFNYDGVVNFDDLLLLAKNYNVSLPPAAAPSLALSRQAARTSAAKSTARPSPVMAPRQAISPGITLAGSTPVRR